MTSKMSLMPGMQSVINPKQYFGNKDELAKLILSAGAVPDSGAVPDYGKISRLPPLCSSVVGRRASSEALAF